MNAAEARRLAEKHMSEKDFQKQVIDLFRVFGWRVAHFRAGMTQRVDKKGRPIWVTPVQADGKGFPDLVGVHTRMKRVVAAELKREGQHPTLNQHAWLSAFNLTGKVETYVWRPSDLPEIARILGAET